MIIVAVFLSGCLVWYLSDLQRQINEIQESVQILHRDFAEKVYLEYLERFEKDGEE